MLFLPQQLDFISGTSHVSSHIICYPDSTSSIQDGSPGGGFPWWGFWERWMHLYKRIPHKDAEYLNVTILGKVP